MKPSSLNQPLVILARHGETNFNSTASGDPEKIRGWMNVPLNSSGQREAKRLGKELSGYPITGVMTSDLSRAEDTAQAIAKPHNISPIRTDTLRPWNLGDLQGESVTKALPAIKHFTTNSDQPPPGGESFDDFRTRFLTTLQSVLNSAKANNTALALVSHTRNAQLTKAWLANGADPNLSINPKIMNDYSNQAKTGSYGLILPSKSGGWDYHQITNSEPMDFQEYSRGAKQAQVAGE